MAICTLIESARYANDIGITVRTAALDLTSAAETEPISDEELNKEMAQIGAGIARGPQRNSKFSCVRMTVLIPYVGTFDELLRDYRSRHLDKGQQA